jgi:hypothetical protein
MTLLLQEDASELIPSRKLYARMHYTGRSHSVLICHPTRLHRVRWSIVQTTVLLHPVLRERGLDAGSH